MTDPGRGARPLVIGLGADLRGDDGVGLDVVRALRQEAGLPADVAEDPGDLTRLWDLWEGRSTVFLVDAIRSGAPPGTLYRWDRIDAGGFPVESTVSTHAISLSGALELARHLGKLPPRLVVLGIEAGGTSLGEGRSPPVRAAARRLVRQVAHELRGLPGTRGSAALGTEEQAHA